MSSKVHRSIGRKHLQKIQALERRKYHPLLHHIHRKHNIAKRTLFYIKEYGSRSHASHTIIRESVRVLLFASLVSLLGGLSFEAIRSSVLTFMPLIILLPALNGMIGGYGIIMCSRFTTLLYEGKVTRSWQDSPHLRKLFLQVVLAAVFTAIISIIAALCITYIFQGTLDLQMAFKIFLIVIIDIALLLSGLFFIAIIGGFYFYKKKEDPNNFLIPITTSLADFGNMAVLAILVIAFF